MSEKEAIAGIRDPLEHQLGYQLRRASAMMMGEVAAALGEVELRVTEASVLLVVEANPGITQSDVGKVLGIQRANMVPIVTALTGRGLVARGRNDGRAQPLTVTLAGDAVAERVREIIEVEERRMAREFDAETRERLIEALQRYRGAAD